MTICSVCGETPDKCSFLITHPDQADRLLAEPVTSQHPAPEENTGKLMLIDDLAKTLERLHLEPREDGAQSAYSRLQTAILGAKKLRLEYQELVAAMEGKEQALAAADYDVMNAQVALRTALESA